MRPAVFSVLHPRILEYVRAFGDSLRRQSSAEFDLWLALDGVTQAAALDRLGEGLRPFFFESENGATPGRVRQRAFATLVDRYVGIVFVDADDVLLPERVAAAERGLREADVDVCALRLIDSAGADLGLTLTPERGVFDDERLARRNVVGLSNSAYRTDVLRRLLPIPDECRIVDWLLATRARDQGARLHVDPEPRMQYRQHADNTAPVLPPFDAAMLQRGIGHVLDHQRLLLQGTPALGDASRAAVMSARERVLAFQAALADDAGKLARYLAALNARTPPFFWWEWVAHPALEATWRTA